MFYYDFENEVYFSGEKKIKIMPPINEKTICVREGECTIFNCLVVSRYQKFLQSSFYRHLDEMEKLCK